MIAGSERPLAGCRMVLLRPADAPRELAAALEDEGAELVEIPLVEVEVADGFVERLAGRLDPGPDGVGYDYLVFTSARGVGAAAPVLEQAISDERPLPLVAVVGTATARAVEALGLDVAFVPSRSTAACLAEELPAVGSKQVLAPLAELAGPDLAEGLEARAFRVDVDVAYRLVPAIPDAGLWASVANGAVGGSEPVVVVFTSPSLVDRWVELGGSSPPMAVSIGPRTSDRLRHHGMGPVVEADPHNAHGIVTAALAAVGRQR